MADKIIENNQVSIMGKIDTGFTFSHQVFGEGFYTMEILVDLVHDFGIAGTRFACGTLAA